MSTNFSPTQPKVLAYLAKLGPKLDPLAARIFSEGTKEDVPIVSSDLGFLLQFLVSAHKPKVVVELGTAIGYSTLFMARALKEFGPRGAKLHTSDIDAARQKRAAAALKKDGTLPFVKFHLQPGLELLHRWKGPIDFLFIDAVKEEYIEYVELALPHMKPGALIVADNVLWSGRVAGMQKASSDHYRSSTKALAEFNEYLVNHPRILGQVIPVGDGVGLGVVRKKPSSSR